MMTMHIFSLYFALMEITDKLLTRHLKFDTGTDYRHTYIYMKYCMDVYNYKHDDSVKF